MEDFDPDTSLLELGKGFPSHIKKTEEGMENDHVIPLKIVRQALNNAGCNEDEKTSIEELFNQQWNHQMLTIYQNKSEKNRAVNKYLRSQTYSKDNEKWIIQIKKYCSINKNKFEFDFPKFFTQMNAILIN